MTPTPSRGGTGTSSMPACSPGTSSTSTTAASSWSSARTSRHPRPRLSTPAGAGCFSNGAQSTRSRRNAKRRRRMSRARKRYLAWAALALLTGALAVAAAGCGGGGGSKSSSKSKSNLPSSIGKGEGALNLIEWPYYSDPSFAKKFEQNTGCKIHRKDAGSSNQMVALMRAGGGGGGGQWDLVSASGDASLRLIKGGDVKPVNVDLIPSWKNFIPIFKSPAHNTVDGVHYGVSLQWGPNVLLYNHKKLKRGPTNWGALYDPKYKGQITIPNNPIQIADAAFYLMHSKPELGIKDPYELNKPQFDATITLLKQQRPLIKKYWSSATDQIDLMKNGDATLGATWPYQTITLQA